MGVECAWEITENTDAIIHCHQATHTVLMYYSVSVINSVMDIGLMIAGFWLACLGRIGCL
ncbi:hypothetical protein C4E04_01285 [Microvirga sp. 17 mud 1-3]|nr:hypothetical protein C4E04_01285 [Microvirga sp. 17 mud 1-3]